VKALLVAAALLGLTACGSVSLRPAPAGSPSVAPTGGAQVTDADENKTLRFHVGDTFEVVLHEQPGFTPWQNLQPMNHTVLQPLVDTRAAAVRGVTLARFRAAAIGSTDLTATASVACSPGAACPALARLWRVTIVVSA
jgi:hypothetical protein